MSCSLIRKLVSLVLCAAFIVCMPYCKMACASEESFNTCKEYEDLIVKKVWSLSCYWNVPNNSSRAPWFGINKFQYSESFKEFSADGAGSDITYWSVLTCDETGSVYLTTMADYKRNWTGSFFAQGKVSFNWTSDSDVCYMLIDAGEQGSFLYRAQ